MNGYIAAAPAFALAALLTIAAPASAETIHNLKLVQPPALPQSEALQAQADQAQVEAPAPEQPKATTTHHKKRPAHHKHHAKKKTSPTSSVAKPHKKAVAHAHHKVKSKLAAQHRSKDVHTQRLATLPTRHAKAVSKTVRPAPDASMAAVPAIRAPGPVKTAGTASKTVAYNFCLGYDNCAPHRYEATVQGGKVGAKVMQQDNNGNWSEASLDPVMMTELNKLAAAEPESRTERALTPDEKELIADHQGKMHATLVSEVQGGETQKEQIKKIMREINIRNLNDLDAYDPRLRRHEAAVEAVNEISVGR